MELSLALKLFLNPTTQQHNMQIKEIQTKELHIAEGVNNELHLTCEDDQNPMLVLHSKQLDDSASLTFEQATLAVLRGL